MGRSKRNARKTKHYSSRASKTSDAETKSSGKYNLSPRYSSISFKAENKRLQCGRVSSSKVTKLSKKREYMEIKQLVFWSNRLSDNVESDPNGHKWLISNKICQDEFPKQEIDIDRVPSELFWITNYLAINPFTSEYEDLAFFVIQKINKCHVIVLELHFQVLTLDELLFLGAYVEELTLASTTITENDGITQVMFETIIENFPKLKRLEWSPDDNCECFSSHTVKELLKIPHFGSITKLNLIDLPEVFDVKTFFKYIKTRENLEVDMVYCREGQYSKEFEQQLKNIIEEVKFTQFFNYIPPFIRFYPGVGIKEKKKMR